MADTVVQFGGCLTINWRHRNIAPERLWDASYRDLVQDMRNRGAWFTTAGEAVRWSQKHRSVLFEAGRMRAKVAAGHDDGLPGLRLRIHKGRESQETSAQGPEDYVDLAFDEGVDSRVLCGVSR